MVTSPLIIHYRKQLVNVGNELERLHKLALATEGISINVYPLVKNAWIQIIQATQSLSDNWEPKQRPKFKADFYEQSIKNDSEKFVLWKEVNNQNLSIAQRKFLRTLTCAFHNKIGAFEPDVCNLTCIQIRQVVELFSRYLLNQMICLEKLKERPKPKRKDLGNILKRMDELAEEYEGRYEE